MQSKCGEQQGEGTQRKLLWLGRFLREMTPTQGDHCAGGREGSCGKYKSQDS